MEWTGTGAKFNEFFHSIIPRREIYCLSWCNYQRSCPQGLCKVQRKNTILGAISFLVWKLVSGDSTTARKQHAMKSCKDVRGKWNNSTWWCWWRSTGTTGKPASKFYAVLKSWRNSWSYFTAKPLRSMFQEFQQQLKLKIRHCNKRSCDAFIFITFIELSSKLHA